MPDNSRTKIARSTMRTVVSLYPRRFRERFGDQILQTFADLIDDISDHGRSLLLLTVASLYDASVGVAQEWAKEILTTMLQMETTTRIATALCVPFLLLIGAALIDGTILNAQLLSLATVDGQQLNGIGRLLVFGGVLLLPISFAVNLAGIFARRNSGDSFLFAPSVSAALVFAAQTIAIVTIGVWMVTEAVRCSAGVCD